MFKRRLFQEMKTTYQYWKSLVDWITLLYLTVPTAFFGYYFLRETVFQKEYGVLESFPSYIVVAAIVFITGMLNNRYYIDYADRLFFIQHKKKFRFVKLYAFIFSYLKNIVVLTVLYSLLYSYFKEIKVFEIWQLVQLAFVLLLGLVLSEMARYLHKGWQQVIVTSILFGLLIGSVYVGSYIVIITAVLFVLSVYFFIKTFIFSTNYFEKQSELEFEASTKIQSMMLKMNPQFAGIKPEIFKRKRPMLWKKLYAKSPTGAISELVLKTFWRRKKYVMKYFQFIGITVGLIFVLPIWAGFILIIVYWFGMKQYIEAIVYEIKDSSFAHLFQTVPMYWEKATKFVSKWLIIPPISIYLIVIVIKVIM
jgi:ABC-2 type transport system permease protein